VGRAQRGWRAAPGQSFLGAKQLRVEKFLFVANQYPPNVVGGAEISVQTLVEALRSRGHETAVVSLSQDGASTVDSVHGTRVYRLPVRNLYHPFRDGVQSAPRRLAWHAADVFNPAMGRALGKVLDAETPSWVSTHNLGGFSVAAWVAAVVLVGGQKARPPWGRNRRRASVSLKRDTRPASASPSITKFANDCGRGSGSPTATVAS